MTRGLSLERLAIQSWPRQRTLAVRSVFLDRTLVGAGRALVLRTPNVGMDQTPQLYWTLRIQGIQLDRRAPWDRSTSLRFCPAQSRRRTDGLSRRANRHSSYPMSPSPDTAAGATPSLRRRQAEARTIPQTSPTHADCRWRLLNFAASSDPPVASMNLILTKRGIRFRRSDGMRAGEVTRGLRALGRKSEP